jgi:hypothetical protein
LAGRAGNLPLFLQGEKQSLKNISAFFALEFINGHGLTSLATILGGDTKL